MNVFLKKLLQAPEEGEDGAAAGGPADTDAGSEGESEFESLHDEIESGSYEDDVDEGGSDESDSKDDAAAEEETLEGEENSDAEDSEEDDEDDGADEDGEEEDPGKEDEEDEDEGEEQPEPLTPEQLTEARNNFVQGIAEQIEISDEDAEALITDPKSVLPKLLAENMAKSVEYAVNIMRNNLPTLVGSQVQQQSRAVEVENKFFGQFPELKSKQAIKVATQVAKVYRETNPDASLEETMENVAFLTYRKLGLPMEKLMEKLGGGDGEEFRGGTQRKQKQGFNPANAGKQSGAAPHPGQAQPENEFEELATLMQNDSMYEE